MTNTVSSIASHNPELLAIDWDVHKLIEAERRGFDDTPLAALRRLLGLDVEKQRIRVKAVPSLAVEEPHEWEGNGVKIPDGTKARFSYRRDGKPINGVFKGGKLVAAGKEYDSFSSAANDLAITKGGKKTRLNGWLYWALQFEGDDKWVIADTLRKGKK